MPKVESDLWWRAHSHPMSTSGPPPPVTTELMRVGQRLLIGIRSPAKRPTAPDASPTSSRQGTVHDVINAAVERAQSTSTASTNMSPSARWPAVAGIICAGRAAGSAFDADEDML